MGIGSKIKSRIRKLIPNELSELAVKAAPIVGMVPGWGPIAAATMSGIGGFDQTGRIGQSLKNAAKSNIGKELEESSELSFIAA